ncbi:hypothetical protein B0H67DRAFT_53894 [Lasiosphaeris hirsuta]|uniref:Secreted protein n=1 Tax=Lasiosphaeris hirsuta TaxID=260670 RepID=A0AA40BAX6_9PEZI|nr:hypothetical protein B0H67DRAFT_53894 [Lasiosphaeris hirsuta]
MSCPYETYFFLFFFLFSNYLRAVRPVSHLKEPFGDRNVALLSGPLGSRSFGSLPSIRTSSLGLRSPFLGPAGLRTLVYKVQTPRVMSVSGTVTTQ